MAGFFWLYFDTTVTSPLGPVHNIGLMQERQVGLMVGLAVAGAGVMMAGFTALLAARENDDEEEDEDDRPRRRRPRGRSREYDE